ncbi:HNH endonuclease [Rhodococcus pyridinivorans]|uniref:HNH endonuclease n=2 Tax=Rhodococcus pyridinivorans TaxID=103816 RepID=A0A7M2XUG0_9NOCA|nr:HNH endonuclease [Rhodococcus pyridinivorans]
MAGADTNGTAEHRPKDGVVRRTDLIRILLNPQIAEHLASILVEVGLWHAPGHTCPRCPEVEPGTYLFHDWFDMGYDPGDKVDITRRKRKELKDQEIINSVWARDCIDPAKPTEANCRYCGILIRRKDTRSETGRRASLDHVDPNRADGVRNIVLCCTSCNQHKGQRTPAQADMVLLPPPARDNVSPHPAAEKVSPHRSAAENVSPTTVAAETGSPDHRAAEMTSPDTRAAETARPTSSDATTRRPRPDQTTDHAKRAVPTRATRARTGVAGSGQGQGWVTGEGYQDGLAAAVDERSPRKRRRGRGGRNRNRNLSTPDQLIDSSKPIPEPEPESREWDAGAAPHVPAPGRFGSPWARWTGPPSMVDETTCPIHHLPEPCWKCAPPEGHPHDH